MRATLRIECKDAEIIRKSLLPDVQNRDDLKVNLKTEKNDLIIEIETEKISYLKAVINSYLSLVKGLKELEDLNGHGRR
jgi:tRNA threonylcarbamoyladenosine modification (KEOPS) complex  Pcc1 subunit